MDIRESQVTISEIQEALCQVVGIKAARVVTSPEGVIQEIHVLALPNKAPKQLVRDIESTIIARFGIPIDHKKISIAQLGPEALPEEPAAEAARPPQHDESRARIVSINNRTSGVYATVTIELELDGEMYTGQATGAASQTSRLRLVAQATLDAIEQYAQGAYSFALEDVAIAKLGREKVGVSCVALVTPMGEQTYSGTALVNGSENDSVVKATMDAINRRMHFLTIT